jgi:RNA polymerase-binding transcription factor DksA
MARSHGDAFVHDGVREALEARRAQLTGELGRLAARMRERGAEAVLDPESAADDVDATLANLKHAMLRRVDTALARLQDGRYGRCTRCGGSIAEARLAALPFAVRCGGCEAARERSSAARPTTRHPLFDSGAPMMDPWSWGGDNL